MNARAEHRNDSMMIEAMANGIAVADGWADFERCAKTEPASAKTYKQHARSALKGLMELRRNLLRQEITKKNSPYRKVIEKYGMKIKI